MCSANIRLLALSPGLILAAHCSDSTSYIISIFHLRLKMELMFCVWELVEVCRNQLNEGKWEGNRNMLKLHWEVWGDVWQEVRVSLVDRHKKLTQLINEIFYQLDKIWVRSVDQTVVVTPSSPGCSIHTDATISSLQPSTSWDKLKNRGKIEQKNVTSETNWPASPASEAWSLWHKHNTMLDGAHCQCKQFNRAWVLWRIVHTVNNSFSLVIFCLLETSFITYMWTLATCFCLTW